MEKWRVKIRYYTAAFVGRRPQRKTRYIAGWLTRELAEQCGQSLTLPESDEWSVEKYDTKTRKVVD